MDVPRETKWLLLLGLILLNILIRFPLEDQFREHRVDTFNLHAMTESVVDTNEARWAVHPLSVCGLYPYSYPSLPVFLTAAIAMLTGLGIEQSILVLAQATGLASIGMGYILGGEVRDDFRYRYLFAALVSLAPAIAFETVWAIPKRTLFLLEFGLMLWLLIRFRRSHRDMRYLLLMIPVLFAMAATHRMFILVPLMFIAYIGTSILLWIWRHPPVLIHEQRQRYALKWGILALWAAGIIGLLYLQARRALFYADTTMWRYYSTGFFFNGTSTKVIFLNAIIDYWSSIGLLTALGLLGLLTFIHRPVWDVLLFNMALIALFSFGIMLGQYMVFLFIPLFTLFTVEGFFTAMDVIPHLRRLLIPAFLGGILLSAGFSGFMVQHWTGDTATPGVGSALPSEDTYSGALFLRHRLPPGNAFCNDFFIAKRVCAYAHVYVDPTYDVLYPTFGLIDVEKVDTRLVRPGEVTPNMNTIYLAVERPDRDIDRIPWTGLENLRDKETKERYEFHYAVINNNMPDRMRIYSETRKSKFFGTIYETRVTLYRNGLITLSMLEKREVFT